MDTNDGRGRGFGVPRIALSGTSQLLRPDGIRRLNGWSFVVFGIIFFVWGVIQSVMVLRLESMDSSARGTVIDRAGGIYPVVRFTTASGASVQFRDHQGSKPASYSVGEKVRVRYRAGGPAESAAIDRGIWNWTGPAVFGLVTLLCTLFAIKLLRVRDERPSPITLGGQGAATDQLGRVAIPLGADFNYYLAHQSELVSKYGGKSIAIKGGEVIGVFDDPQRAVEETQKYHALGSFLVINAQPSDGIQDQQLSRLSGELAAQSEQAAKSLQAWRLPPELSTPPPRLIKSVPLGTRLSRSLSRAILFLAIAIGTCGFWYLLGHHMSVPGMLNAFLEFLKAPRVQGWMIQPGPAISLVAFAVVGAWLVVLGYIKQRKERRLLKWGKPTRAIAAARRYGSHTYWTFEYSDAAGSPVSVREVHSGRPKRASGVITVLYDPDRPREFIRYPGVSYEIAGSKEF
jgi:hypothetical protein